MSENNQIDVQFVIGELRSQISDLMFELIIAKARIVELTKPAEVAPETKDKTLKEE